MQCKSEKKEKPLSCGDWTALDRPIGIGVYGQYFIKLDRRFAAWGVDDDREFDLAGDWYLRRVLWNWWRGYCMGGLPKRSRLGRMP